MDSFTAVSGMLLRNSFFFLIALAACSFFSFLETCISSVRLYKLKEISRRVRGYKQLLTTMERDPDKILSIVLIAKNLADITTAMLSAYIVDTLSAMWHLSENVSFFLGIGAATFVILIFGEIIPKSIAKIHGDRLLVSNLWIINFLFYSLFPFLFLAKFARYLAQKIEKFQSISSSEESSEKEIQFLIEHVSEAGHISSEKVKMLMSVFSLSQKSVREIMVPKTSIIALPADMRLKEALNVFAKYQISRLPVFDKNFDDMVGILHQKDVFSQLQHGKDCLVEDFIRPLLFVPEHMKLNQLLNTLQKQRMHLAIVINEYGSVDGLVTLEDVLEEIVGDIHDEHDEFMPKMLQVKPGGWLVDASINLAKVGALLKINFEKDSASTLGGFLAEKLQHVPKKGEKIEYKNFQFQVKKANAKQVFQILIVLQNTNIAMNKFGNKGERGDYSSGDQLQI